MLERVAGEAAKAEEEAMAAEAAVVKEEEEEMGDGDRDGGAAAAAPLTTTDDAPLDTTIRRLKPSASVGVDLYAPAGSLVRDRPG